MRFPRGLALGKKRCDFKALGERSTVSHPPEGKPLSDVPSTVIVITAQWERSFDEAESYHPPPSSIEHKHSTV